MKIGIFDSGLGGLVITQAIIKELPQYDLIYLGDTARLPYGDRSEAEVFNFVKQSVDFLFGQDCQLAILACNTASARALREIQQNYLPKKYPGRRVLGVIIPTAEVAALSSEVIIGVIATKSTVKSNVYKHELKKLSKNIKVFQKAAPDLVPLIEAGRIVESIPYLQKCLRPLQNRNVSSLILGCTHYPLLKKQIKKIMGPKVNIVDQTEIIPKKLKEYLRRHPETSNILSHRKNREFYVTKLTPEFDQVANKLIGRHVRLKTVKLK